MSVVKPDAQGCQGYADDGKMAGTGSADGRGPTTYARSSLWITLAKMLTGLPAPPAASWEQGRAGHSESGARSMRHLGHTHQQRLPITSPCHAALPAWRTDPAAPAAAGHRLAGLAWRAGQQQQRPWRPRHGSSPAACWGRQSTTASQHRQDRGPPDRRVRSLLTAIAIAARAPSSS